MISVPAHPIDLATIRASDLREGLEELARRRTWDAEDGDELSADKLGMQSLSIYRIVDKL